MHNAPATILKHKSGFTPFLLIPSSKFVSHDVSTNQSSAISISPIKCHEDVNTAKVGLIYPMSIITDRVSGVRYRFVLAVHNSFGQDVRECARACVCVLHIRKYKYRTEKSFLKCHPTPLQGRIQNFLIGGSKQKGFDLLSLSDFSLFYLIFLKIHHEDTDLQKVIGSKRWLEAQHNI